MSHSRRRTRDTNPSSLTLKSTIFLTIFYSGPQGTPAPPRKGVQGLEGKVLEIMGKQSMILADHTLSLERQNPVNVRHAANKKTNNAQKLSQ